MSYCVNPDCQSPQNPDKFLFCQNCGANLLLKERYRCVKFLGEGGFGRTFVATDEQKPSHPQCVVKQLLVTEKNPTLLAKIIELFHREAQRLEELGHHPQIPDFFANFNQDNRFYLVQELIVGANLDDELKASGCLNEAKIRELLTQILPILDFLHQHQVVHRDIKPANIIRRSSDGQLFLIDFGLAKILPPEALAKTGTIVGTPEYVAPEQLQGKAVPSSDLYSLGITCIYLLTGVSPFQLFDINEHRWVWQDYLPPHSQVSGKLANILNRMLQPAVKYRYESAQAVIKALTFTVEKQTPKAVAIAPKSQKPIKVEEVALELFKKHILKLPTTVLTSSQGVDYSELERLLATQKWQKADLETESVLLAAMNKSLGKYLSVGDIARIPLEDLEIIDRLWLKYSQHKFGFRVQSQIFREVGQDYPIFCAKVGWSVHNPQFIDSMLDFSWQAPKGHLPSRRWVGGSQWWNHAAAMACRFP